MSERRQRVGVGLGRWREPWVGLGAIVFLVQLAVLWTVSPNPNPAAPQRAAPRQRMVTEATDTAGGRLLDAWRWLFTPALMVLPPAEDYSGPAWMRGAAVRIEVEAFDVPDRPLPWQGDRPGVLVPGLGGKSDPVPSVRWELTSLPVAVPFVSQVAVATTVRVRVLGPIAGRYVVQSLGSMEEAGRGVGLARPVVVKVWVDRLGDLERPPVVWESSESAAADESALRYSRRMRFAPGADHTVVEWGLVVFEWGVSAEAGEEATNASKG